MTASIITDISVSLHYCHAKNTIPDDDHYFSTILYNTGKLIEELRGPKQLKHGERQSIFTNAFSK